MSLTVGETLAGYRILRRLGSGGMGEVYLAQHPRLPREEALKVLRPDLSSDVSFRRRFIREADLAAGLRHPHIVGVHDRGEYHEQLWIAMDYIDGTDADRLITRDYRAGMPIGLVVAIVTAIASALDYAHKKSLLHRDIKPANIIVADLDTDGPNVFLADFGIARPLDETGGITATNMAVGTVAYAAPEQLMGEALDGRADQYALAATAYHLLTGSQLFPNSNPAVVISHQLNSAPPKFADHRPELAGLDAVLNIALAKNPGSRYASCTAFAHTLVAGLHGEAAAASAPTQLAPQPHRPEAETADRSTGRAPYSHPPPNRPPRGETVAGGVRPEPEVRRELVQVILDHGSRLNKEILVLAERGFGEGAIAADLGRTPGQVRDYRIGHAAVLDGEIAGLGATANANTQGAVRKYLRYARSAAAQQYLRGLLRDLGG